MMNDRDFMLLCLGAAALSIVLMMTGDPAGAAIICGFLSLMAFGRWSLNR